MEIWEDFQEKNRVIFSKTISDCIKNCKQQMEAEIIYNQQVCIQDVILRIILKIVNGNKHKI